MAGRVVSGQVAVAKSNAGVPMYFYRGDVLPDDISKESVAHLDRRGLLVKGKDEFVVMPDAVPAESDDDSDQVSQPGGNASLEDWQSFARSQGASDGDLEGKSRNDLRDEFGK